MITSALMRDLEEWWHFDGVGRDGFTGNGRAGRGIRRIAGEVSRIPSSGGIMTAISRQDAPVAMEGDGVELRMREIGGDLTTAFVRLPKGEALEDCEYVDFSPTRPFNEVINHVTSQPN
jgi:hypothetical protein